MTAMMMPGGPVADAVFAELRPRIDEAASPTVTRPGWARSSSATTTRAPATSA